MSVTQEKLEEIFKVYDENRENRIPTVDLRTLSINIAKLIRSARMFPSDQDIDMLKKQVDPQREGRFSMKSFVEVGLDFARKQS